MSRKQRRQTPKRSFTSPLAIAAALFFCVVTYCLVNHRPEQADEISTAEKTQTASSISQANSAVSPKLPEYAINSEIDQERFVEQELLPLISEIETNYPIEPIREQFALTMNKFRAEDVNFTFSSETGQLGVASAGVEDGQKSIIVCVPYMMETFMMFDWNKEYIMDELIDVFLHEGHHLFVQLKDVSNSAWKHPEEYRQRESDCWWYMVENVHLPMIDAGRLQRPSPGIQAAHEAYLLSQGDPNHPAWVQFSCFVTGLQQMYGDPWDVIVARWDEINAKKENQ